MAEEDHELVSDLETFDDNNPELKDLESILGDFNPFSAARWIWKELGHSAFLRWFLDPRQTHQLGPQFLGVFLKHLAENAKHNERPLVSEIDSWNLRFTRVFLEWQNIDLLIRDDENQLAVVIKNEIQGKERERQLKGCQGLVASTYPEYKKLFCYLTVRGEDPGVDGYVPLGFGAVIELIEKAVGSRGGEIGSEVQDFVGRYVEMLRRLESRPLAGQVGS